MSCCSAACLRMCLQLYATLNSLSIIHHQALCSALHCDMQWPVPVGCSRCAKHRNSKCTMSACSSRRCCDAGRREWAPIQKWCHVHMETALKAWFGNVEVVREGNTPFDPADKYIFGYTPHGLFPIGVLACQDFCRTVYRCCSFCITWTLM